MKPKPDSCRACALYGDGKGFVPDEDIPGAPVKVVMQNPGRMEEMKGTPACGDSGKVMDHHFLPLAGLVRGENVSVGNVLKCRWQRGGKRTNEVPSGRMLQDAAAHCLNTHMRIPPGTKCVVAQGEVAARLLGGIPANREGGQPSIMQWRGFYAPQPYCTLPVYVVLHTAYLFRDNRMFEPTMHDWVKLRRALSGTWPLPVPSGVTIYNTQSGWNALLELKKAPYIIIDTEYTPDRFMTLIGLCGRVGGQVKVVQCVWSCADNAAKHKFIKHFAALVKGKKIVFHNAMADLPVIEKNLHISPCAFTDIEDTMLAHAVRWSEWPHTLAFLASLYSPYDKMKHLSKSDPLKYNLGDVVDTLHAYEHLMKELKGDVQSETVYRTQSLPLVPILLAAKKRGIRLDSTFLAPLKVEVEERVRQASEVASAYCGYPINVGSSQQVGSWVYDVEGMPEQKKQGARTVDKDAIALLRRTWYDFDPEEERGGLSIEQVLRHVEEGAHPLLECRAMYTTAEQIAAHYIAPLEVADERHTKK